MTAVDAAGRPYGMAVGSFTSVSLEPPLVAFLPSRTSTTWPRIQAAGAFCANVLAADQEHVCAALAAANGTDKFAQLPWRPATTGSPIIDGAVAWIDCRVHTVVDAGDHLIVVGRVVDLDVTGPTPPLLFHRGRYSRPAPPNEQPGAPR